MAKKKLSDDEIKQLVEDKLRASMGAPDSQIARDRVRNLEAYLAEPDGEWSPPEISDRSALVATDAADTVEWMLPSLLRVFAAGKDAIDAVPRRPQFEPQAHLVRETLRWQWWDQLDGLTILHSWFKDGLIQRVGFLRLGFSKVRRSVVEPYRGLTEAQLQSLLADGGDEVQIVGQAQRVEPTEAGPAPVFDVDIERTEEEGRPTVEVVPPEEMRIDSGARYGSEPTFIAQEYRRRRSELMSEGYDVADISAADGPSGEEYTRRRRIDNASGFDDTDDHDPELRVVDAYVRQGPADDATWERVLLIGDELFEREQTDAHPFAWWCPAPMPHVFFGGCPVDQALEPQRLRTRLLRAVEDNVYLSVNGRTGVVGGDATTIDDILDSRPGGIVRLKSKDDLVPIVQPDLSAAAWSAVEWAQQWTEQRTGFSRLSKGLSSEALNETATGVMEITERADMRVELIARHAAAALSTVLAKLLRVMSRHQDVAQAVRIAGQWVDVDPRQWDMQYQVRVSVGLGAANKDRQVAQLGQLLGVQQGMLQAGMVPPQSAVALARKLAESMGFDTPEQFFPDPPPPQPPQPPLPLLIEQFKSQARQAEVQASVQADIAKSTAALNVQAANDARDAERAQLQAQLDAQLQAQEHETKRRIAEMQAGVDRYRVDMESAVKLQIAAAQQPQPVDLSGLQRVEDLLQQLMAAVAAPKRVVRDPQTGRVVGVEVAAAEPGTAFSRKGR